MVRGACSPLICCQLALTLAGFLPCLSISPLVSLSHFLLFLSLPVSLSFFFTLFSVTFPLLSFSALSLASFLPSSLLPHSPLVWGALMASMYSSSDTVTSAGREGLSLTTQPANEIFPHLINTIRILILTESI